MALTATIYNFDVDLSDTDRHVYETVSMRVAQHPSESNEYLIARLLAYLLEYSEGIAFSRGVSEPDEPPIAVRDLTGRVQSWIEIGTPDTARLHKASKAAARVAVVLSQGSRAVASAARRAGHSPRVRIGAVLDRSRLGRRAGVEAGSTNGVCDLGERSRGLCVDRQRQPCRPNHGYRA